MNQPTPFNRAPLPKDGSTRQLGLIVFFASVTSLFIATVAAVLLTRFSSVKWPTGRLEELRGGLLVSTALLGACSLCFGYATRALKANRERALLRSLWAAAGFALLFLFAQSQNILRAWSVVNATQDLYSFSFSLLTGVHALHILGGLVPLAIVMRRAASREYSSSRGDGVQFCAQYWHLLGAIWLVILLVLFLI